MNLFSSKKYNFIVLSLSTLIIFALLSFWPKDTVVAPEIDFPVFPVKEYKIGIITDIQTTRKKSIGYGLDPELIVAPLERFIAHTNETFQPNHVVHIGDLIEGTKRRGQKSIDDWKAIDAYLARLIPPRLHVIGNHERRGLSDDEWKTLSGNISTYYAYDTDTLRVLILDYDDFGKQNDTGDEGENVDLPDEGKKTYRMSQEQLQWIEEKLKEARGRQIVVFVHVPVDDPINPPEQQTRLKHLFAAYRVKAVIAGHVETLSYKEESNVRYYTLPGFFRSENKSTAHWYGTYYDGIVSDIFSIKMYYKKDILGEYAEVTIPSPEYDLLGK